MNLQAQLQSPYSGDAWVNLLRDIFGSSAELFSKPAPIHDPVYNGVFNRVLHLGDLKTADGKTAALLDIEVAPDLSLPRNRAGIRHLAARMIDGVTRPATLATFHAPQKSDWRFSYIAREISYDLSTGQTHTFETPARRFTYLLGPNEKCRTATERFSTLQHGPITLSSIEEAFKVDKLTKEFYGELSDWYFWALTRVTFPDDIVKDKDTRNATMTIRLITRLMFVWFLKKKDLIPECLFEKAAVDQWLNWSDTTGSTYYKAVLQNLFFATLNFDPKEGRRDFIDWGKKGVLGYRYKRFFKRGAAERFIELCKEIPFLNGGLFENLDKDVETASPRRVDCFSNAEENERKLVVPDELFFGKEQTVNLAAFYDDKKKSAVKVKGLIEILNSYNFTVEENTPYDKDVALDPELLGQVFENLLASFNPETRTTARKQTGSFYTPREIVQYMVDESLVAHLKHAVGESLEPEYRKLTSYTSEPLNLTAKQSAAIVQALFSCRILDPACGSGAFPMGILQQMVHILNQLDPHNTYLKNQALKQVQDEANAVANDASALDDKMEKMRETLRLFDDTVTRPDYARKLLLIENSIYGVDIQPVAVQIAKLRFFISLVVEQTAKDDIRPLPNLETNFVAANTLIGITKPKDTFFADDPQVADIEKALKANRHRHFFARTTKTKLACRKEDKRLRDALQQRLVDLATKPDEAVITENLALIQKLETDRAKYLTEKWEKRERQEQTDLFGTTAPEQQTFSLRVDINKAKRDKIDSDIRHCHARIDAERAKAKNNAFTKEAQKLALWDPYDQNATSGFFDPEWMFGITAGFDIVIGNPPYIQLQNNGGELADLYKDRGFESYARTGDIYALFYERAHQLLKRDALLCFITSNKWMRSGYGESLRKFFAEKTHPQILVDFAGQKMFEAATVDTNILITRNTVAPANESACGPAPCLAVVANENCRQQLSVFVQQNAALQSFGAGPSWVILSPIEKSIKAKVEQAGTPLKDWDVNIYRGILTGCNEAFIIDEAKRQALIEQDPKSAEIIRPILRGRDIKRYRYTWAGLYIIATFPALHIDIDQYPAVKSYLLSFGKDRLEQSGKISKLNGRNIAARKKTGNNWFETQDQIGYWEDFFKQKIVWCEISDNANFALDVSDNYCVNNKCYLMTGMRLKYLTCYLNSSLSEYLFSKIATTTGVGTLQWSKFTIEQLPVPEVTKEQEGVFERLLAGKVDRKAVDMAVYELCQLTGEEIAFIEEFAR